MRNSLILSAYLIVSVLFNQDLSAQTKETLADSVFFHQALSSFSKGNNQRRFRFLKKYSHRKGLNNLSVKTQAIDWLGLYKNVIVEKKGETDSVIYIVCHYDKIDGSLLSLPNLFINGSLDVLFSNLFLSEGAYDNGTGVVSSLDLMIWINDYESHYTYRFLFAGMEEYGLRGSRRHVSGLSQKEWDRCVFAINIDMIAAEGTSGITVTQNVSDRQLMKLARTVSRENNFTLTEVDMPKNALSDFRSFTGQSFLKDFGFSLMVNATGAFLPQRSYFTRRKHAIPIINFSDDEKFTVADYLSTLSPISFGTVHSFHDKRKRVSIENLVEYSRFLKLYVEAVDRKVIGRMRIP